MVTDYSPHKPAGYEAKNLRDRPTIEDRIRFVSASEMSESVAGDFSPRSGNIRVREDLPEDYKMFVTKHEVGHAIGYDGTAEGEYKNDCYAASETGKPQYVRGPFFRAPLIFDPSTRKQNYRFN